MQAKRNLSVGPLIWSEIVLTTTTHLLPGRETDPRLLWVQSFLHQVLQFLWGPSVVLSLSVEKKSWKLMEWHKHFLINTSDFRKSAANHCGEHKLSAPPPLTQRGLFWWHMQDSKELVSPTKYITGWVGYWLPSHHHQNHSCSPTAHLRCSLCCHTPAGGQGILQIITKASE